MNIIFTALHFVPMENAQQSELKTSKLRTYIK